MQQHQQLRLLQIRNASTTITTVPFGRPRELARPTRDSCSCTAGSRVVNVNTRNFPKKGLDCDDQVDDIFYLFPIKSITECCSTYRAVPPHPHQFDFSYSTFTAFDYCIQHIFAIIRFLTKNKEKEKKTVWFIQGKLLVPPKTFYKTAVWYMYTRTNESANQQPWIAVCVCVLFSHPQ